MLSLRQITGRSRAGGIGISLRLPTRACRLPARLVHANFALLAGTLVRQWNRLEEENAKLKVENSEVKTKLAAVEDEVKCQSGKQIANYMVQTADFKSHNTKLSADLAHYQKLVRIKLRQDAINDASLRAALTDTCTMLLQTQMEILVAEMDHFHDEATENRLVQSYLLDAILELVPDNATNQLIEKMIQRQRALVKELSDSRD